MLKLVLLGNPLNVIPFCSGTLPERRDCAKLVDVVLEIPFRRRMSDIRSSCVEYSHPARTVVRGVASKLSANGLP